MEAAIRRMGNSAAILLSKPVLAHLDAAAGDVLNLDLREGQVVLSRMPHHPREGWAQAAERLADEGHEAPEWLAFDDAEDADWTW